MLRTPWCLKCSLRACDTVGRPEEGRPARHARFLPLPLALGLALCFSKLLDQFLICETSHIMVTFLKDCTAIV